MKSSTKKRAVLPSRKRLKQSQRLADCHAVVIGAGTLGRAVAILLASLGIKHLSIYDPAFVVKKDLTCGFMDGDEGLAKVDAVANIAHQHNPRMELLTYQNRFRKSHLQKWKPKLKNVVFLCVDSLATRKSIWNEIKQSAQFICHARLSSDVIKVAVTQKPAIDKVYAAMQVRVAYKSCLADLVMNHLAASLMAGQFMRWLLSVSC